MATLRIHTSRILSGPSRSKNPPHEPKLVNKYGCPDTQEEKVAAKLKEK